MKAVRDNCLHIVIYRFMHECGYVTGSICNFVAPVIRSTKGKSKDTSRKNQDLINKSGRVSPREHVTFWASGAQQNEKIPTSYLSGKGEDVSGQVVSTDSYTDVKKFSPEVRNENNKLERIKADVYVKDFVSGDHEMRSCALEHIRTLSLPVAVRTLNNLLAKMEHASLVAEVLNAFSAMHVKDACEKELFAPYLRHSNFIVRIAAARVISKYKDDESFLMLSELMHDNDAKVRKQVLKLFCWTYGDKAALPISTLLRDSDKEVKNTAIVISGALKLKRCISVLISLLSDRDSEIQKNAVSSLQKITGQRIGRGQNKINDAIEAWHLWWRDNQAIYMLP